MVNAGSCLAARSVTRIPEAERVNPSYRNTLVFYKVKNQEELTQVKSNYLNT